MHACSLLRDYVAISGKARITTQFLTSTILPALAGVFLAALPIQASAQTITWSSRSNAVNSTSKHSTDLSGFRFELGVFTPGFTPTSENIGDWAAHWHPAQATFYNPETMRFAGSFTVTHNTSPFVAGADAYIWGFSGTPQASEWILFRKNSWKWPMASNTPMPVNNNSLSWVAERANIVFIGDIQSSGKPHLMKTASVSNTRPPNTPWHVWIQQEMADETLNSPNQDADNDGASNLLEFVMGTKPKNGGGIPGSRAEVVQHNSNKYLQINVPRRIDRTANLTVQVADHPAGPWLSGPEYTTVVVNSIDSLIVRDNIPISPDKPHRFMRLHVELPQ